MKTANSVMHMCADSLDTIGFKVNDRVEAPEVDKAVGCHPGFQLPVIDLPGAKGPLLQQALMCVASRSCADTELIASLVGVWIWGRPP